MVTRSLYWMDGWMDGWMDEWMDGWMNGWMDGWMDVLFHLCRYLRTTWLHASILFSIRFRLLRISQYEQKHHTQRPTPDALT